MEKFKKGDRIRNLAFPEMTATILLVNERHHTADILVDATETLEAFAIYANLEYWEKIKED